MQIFIISITYEIPIIYTGRLALNLRRYEDEKKYDKNIL